MHIKPNVSTTLPALPIVLITGYLGAGKTTFLNHLLSQTEGKKIAVLVNDFGSINIDASLIDTAADDVVALQNGCICCSISGGLHAAIFKVLKRDQRPDLIVIEASGVSNTGEIVRILNDTALLEYAALELVIAMLDCESLLSYDPKELNLIHSQLRYSDIVLLTKVDVANENDIARARKLVEDINPGALVFEGKPENITPGLILGSEEREAEAGARTGKPIFLAEDKVSSTKADELYRSWSYQSSAALSKADFERILKDLPRHTVRGKGFLYLAEYPDNRFAFQMVGRRAQVEPIGQWGTKPPRSEIVFIALKD